MSILRRVMIEERNRLEGKDKRNEAIYNRFFEVYPEASRVFVYVNFGSEVATKPIIERLLSEGKKVFAPRMFGLDMRFFEVTELALLEKSKNGILEPKGDTEEAFPNPDDLMIMPGVIFDEYGGRVGYGMGCYDRYLAKYNCHKCAFAFEMQVQSERMLLKPTDKTYDALLTERRYLASPRKIEENQ